MKQRDDRWSALPYGEWRETLDTLHLWMQIVGKVKLTLATFINQWWEVAFSVTAQGITTGIIPYKHGVFEVNFDFLHHEVSISTSNDEQQIISLEPRTVADFYREFVDALKSLGIDVTINPIPVEIPAITTPFEKDTSHSSYDKEYVTRWWRILQESGIVFEKFRASFRGKSSPVQFYWGSFDLNSTRFSGKQATPPQMSGVMGKIMRYAENEENFAFGFWPGDSRFPYAAFYSYIYPAPNEMEKIKFDEKASFNEQLGECILLYEDVRKTEDPAKTILHFLETTYKESAILAGWNIQELQNNEIPSIK